MRVNGAGGGWTSAVQPKIFFGYFFMPSPTLFLMLAKKKGKGWGIGIPTPRTGCYSATNRMNIDEKWCFGCYKGCNTGATWVLQSGGRPVSRPFQVEKGLGESGGLGLATARMSFTAVTRTS